MVCEHASVGVLLLLDGLEHHGIVIESERFRDPMLIPWTQAAYQNAAALLGVMREHRGSRPPVPY
jgi:hypothetical protein